MVQPAHRPTQRQIADAVGVSVTTVSRILNPDETHPERWASPQTVERIHQAATDLGYRRNALAVSLRTAQSRTVGVMLPMVGDFVLASICAGIDDAARAHQMMTLVTATLEDPELRQERTHAMMDHLVAGIIFADALVEDDFLNTMAERQVPFTLVHRPHQNHLAVTADDFGAGHLAARHLIDLGRRHLAIITGRARVAAWTNRERGFLQAAREAGLAAPQVIDTGFDVRSGQQGAAALLDASPRPDGVFTIHDAAGMGAMSVFRAGGLAVPEDVAVVGCYDTPASLATDLTSVHVDLNLMGRRAFELLLDGLEGRPTQSQALPVSLVVRGSTGPAPAEGLRAARHR